MTDKAELLALADRVDGIGDITCPLCGEGGFDISGFIFSHESWCEVFKACVSTMASRNEEVSGTLRALASEQPA